MEKVLTGLQGRGWSAALVRERMVLALSPDGAVTVSVVQRRSRGRYYYDVTVWSETGRGTTTVTRPTKVVVEAVNMVSRMRSVRQGGK